MTHENTPYAWVDVFFGPHRDALHVIDKRTLEIVKTLRPSPGRTAAHVEFDKNGTNALVSVWEMDGEVVVYDAATFAEVKRLPMGKPSGKYNTYNKIRRLSRQGKGPTVYTAGEPWSGPEPPAYVSTSASRRSRRGGRRCKYDDRPTSADVGIRRASQKSRGFFAFFRVML